MSDQNTTITKAASIPAKDHFFDRLESYLDFRDEGPEVAARLRTELLQACEGVRRLADRVESEMHRQWMAAVIDHDFSRKEWGRDGFKLNYGANLIAQTLHQQAA